MASTVSGLRTRSRSGEWPVLKPKVLIIVLFVLATIVVGFLLAGPQPDISLKAETIFSIGPFNVTNTIITAYTVTAVLVIASFLATRRASLVPSGFYNFVEALVEWMLSVVEEIAGPENGRKFFIVTATIFLFVVSCNYFGLLP